jgi:hypothetical protein
MIAAHTAANNLEVKECHAESFGQAQDDMTFFAKMQHVC